MMNTSRQNLTCYKVIGDEETTLEYNSKWRSRQISDWTGLYFQLSLLNAIGTVPYRWDQGYREAKLLKIDFKYIDIVAYNGVELADYNISGETKALNLKKIFGIDMDKSLIDNLGERGKCLLIKESSEEDELVISQGLIPLLTISEEIICLFTKHSFLPISSQFQPIISKCPSFSIKFENEEQVLNLLTQI